MTFDTLKDFAAALAAPPAADEAARARAIARNTQLTKPEGALGRLEDLAIWYAGWRAPLADAPQKAQALVFAGNHGVAARGVSPYPAEVTAQMVLNFQAGGAAINQFCALAGAELSVHPLRLDAPTHDFTQGPAMREADCAQALQTGWDAVDPGADALIIGEMGIGNTSSAAALCAALFGGSGGDWAGAGAGVQGEALTAKIAIIDAGLARHKAAQDPLEALRCLGGFELAAMVGAAARARMARVPVIMDGFICTAALAVLHRLDPALLENVVAGHVSAERAHARLLETMDKPPLLALGMRLGEGSGAAVALNILRAALKAHGAMASFAEAGVSDKTGA